MANEADEELELQMAIALSLAEAQPGNEAAAAEPAPPQGGASSSASVPTPSVAPQAAPQGQAMAMAAMLQAALAAQRGATAAAPVPVQPAPVPAPSPAAPQHQAHAANQPFAPNQMNAMAAALQAALQGGAGGSGGFGGQQQAPFSQHQQQHQANLLAQSLSAALQGAGFQPPPGGWGGAGGGGGGGGGGDASDSGSEYSYDESPEAAAALGIALPGGHQRRPTAVAAATARLPVGPAAPAPAWAADLSAWWKPEAGAAVLQASASVSADEALSVCTQLGPSFKGKVVLDAAEAKGAVLLKSVVSRTGDGSVTFSADDFQTTLEMWLARTQAVGESRLQALHHFWDALPDGRTLPGPVSAALDMMAARVGRMALLLLKDDEDDLYYAKGKTTAEFLAAIKAGSKSLCLNFLSAMVDGCTVAADGAVWVKVLREALAGTKTLAFEQGGASTQLQGHLFLLTQLTDLPKLRKCMASVLLTEVLQASASGANAKRLEADGLLSPLLSLTSMVDPASAMTRTPTSRAKQLFMQIRGYPNSPGEIQSNHVIIQSMLQQVHRNVHEVFRRMLNAKESGAAAREVLLCWVSATAALNMERTQMGERGLHTPWAISAGGSDGLLLNLTAVMLRFCKPFVAGCLNGEAKFADLFERHLSPTYYTTQAHRLGDMSAVAALAGERGVGATSRSAVVGYLAAQLAGAGVSPGGSAPSTSAAAHAAPPPSFMADAFFLTQKLLHVGILQTMNRYNMIMERLQQQAGQGQDDDSDEEGGGASTSRGRRPQQPPLEALLYNDCCTSHMLEPLGADDVVHFCLLELAWLQSLVSRQQPAVFLTIPEYVVSDLASWLAFVIRMGHADMIASKPVGLLMSSLVALLNNPSCVRSPLIHNKIVNLMLMMMAPQLEASRRQGLGGAALGRTYLRPGEAALVAAVLGTPTAQTDLVPALMRCYVAADFVIGLDVDKDHFDKFGMRHSIDSILGELWRDQRVRGSIVALSTSVVFADYMASVLNGLMYLFEDSLDRLNDIHRIEVAKADTAAWAKLQEHERKDKDGFLASQQRTCKGFMRMAITNLEWLNTLAEDAAIVRALVQHPLKGRCAHVSVHFLDLLVGPQCALLTVEKPEQYQFDKAALMESVCSFMLRLGHNSSAFAVAVSEQPDFDHKTMSHALQLLVTNHRAFTAQRMETFLAAVATASAASTRPGPSRTPPPPGPPTKAARVSFSASPNPDSPPGHGNASAMDIDMIAGSAEAADADSPVSVDEAGTAAGGGTELPSFSLSFPDDDAAAAAATAVGPVAAGAALDATYRGALSGLSVAGFDSTLPRAYARNFAEMADQPAGDTKAKMKRLARELRDLQTKTVLPCHAAASIFVRHDNDRVDKMRAIIVGPEGTPYEGGCFVFDVWFPAGYPAVAPIVWLNTTGEGSMRMNPNLYADGKVCLSLLGTWHGGHASEKWDPEKSTLFQILLSIQGMIFVEDPYFNEPNVESMKNTKEGKERSLEYNTKLRLGNIRWAMIDILKHPTPGFEDVVVAHFKTLRRRLMVTCQRWLKDASQLDAALQRRMDTAVHELHSLLARL